ncbi:MAG: NADH-quinone oxidoreductase subunit G [Rubellimicrobium sp.]|nr:NADH-quinone oxidoreductase subunit G [Rubellimicrobium sp.]
MADLKKVSIDGTVIEVPGAMTLIQACEEAGVEIPRFCYHERLSIAGNCRMCLVEIVGGPPKPAASCAMQVRDLRPGPNGEPPQVRTNSPMVKKAREGVMEFLLINHPLDCPICDQGGECDLQDQAIAYGVDFSRYREPKRALPDLDIGPLIATTMTRCIYCTRCVRFTTEVAGLTEMGTLGRGEDTRVTTYDNEMLAIDGAGGDAVAAALRAVMDSNLSGNVIDLCPVGALTSKPYAFTARPWELTKTESIDVMDALGSNIRLDAKGREIMRILPRNNDAVNEEWLSDKGRFVYDGLRRQRLDVPYVREGGRLRRSTWPEALGLAAKAMKGGRVAGLVGDLVPVEAAFSLRALVEGLGGHVECRTDGARLPEGNRSAYVGNARIEDIDGARRILLIGTDPRSEAPVLNARIRKAWLAGAEVTLIGPAADLTYACTHAGDDRGALLAFGESDLSGWHGKGGVVIVGQGALREADGESVLGHAMKIAAAADARLLVLHTAAGRVGAMDVGAVTEGGLPVAIDGAKVIYNLGADEIEIAPGAFVIYQGSHGDRGAHRADIILPGAAWTEENAIFVNTEGRPQLAQRAAFPPGDAKENWAILRALSGEMGAALPWDSLPALRRAIEARHPHLLALDEVADNGWTPVAAVALGAATFRPAVRDQYLTNPVARASALMAELAANEAARRAAPLAAE